MTVQRSVTGAMPLRAAIDAAAVVLAAAGVSSPRVDAELLAAHVTGTSRGRLASDVTPAMLGRYDGLIAQRARRVPLQHLVGSAAFGPLVVEVGPGVFTPRPETESLLEWSAAQRLPKHPVIVDLCTGSGALALALSKHWPAARVIAVDDSDDALAYARRNVAGTAVELIRADVRTPGLLSQLDGIVDLVVANPPYLPDGHALKSSVLEPEVAEHDPAHALFGGPDGMAVIGPVVGVAARWLREGGLCAVEHDDTTSDATVDAFERVGMFTDVTARRDLAGRPRFVTASRSGEKLTRMTSEREAQRDRA